MARILVADDEDDVRPLLRTIQTRAGYEMVEASDGCSAYKMATEEKPDVVILDLHMPGMNGLEVLKRLKQNEVTKSIPVLMVTGRWLTKYEIESIRSGATDYIVKPLLPADVRARVRLALSHSESG